MSLDRDTCRPLNSITSRKIRPKYTAVLPAARGEKVRASIWLRSIWNMDRVRADRPREASVPRASPAPRESRPTAPVSRKSTRATCPWLRPRSR